jgi:zinc transporter ZupT
MTLFVSLIAVIALAIVHIFAGKLRFLHGTPRSAWLSVAGGVSVAYVFVHLLPDLSEAQETINENVDEGLSLLEHHVYLIALVGLAVFYGLERVAVTSRRRRRSTDGRDATSHGVFWLHVSAFAAYNALIGYLIHQRGEEGRVRVLALFAIAMGLHFVVTDFGLREHYKDAYHQVARWVLTAAILLGWAIGLTGEVHEAALAVLLAFLAGGVILNVLKEELPENRESRFWAFILGAGAYAALLLSL